MSTAEQPRENVTAEQSSTRDKGKDSPVQGKKDNKGEDYLVAKYESTIDEDDPTSGVDPDQMQVNPGF